MYPRPYSVWTRTSPPTPTSAHCDTARRSMMKRRTRSNRCQSLYRSIQVEFLLWSGPVALTLGPGRILSQQSIMGTLGSTLIGADKAIGFRAVQTSRPVRIHFSYTKTCSVFSSRLSQAGICLRRWDQKESLGLCCQPVDLSQLSHRSPQRLHAQTEKCRSASRPPATKQGFAVVRMPETTWCQKGIGFFCL